MGLKSENEAVVMDPNREFESKGLVHSTGFLWLSLVLGLVIGPVADARPLRLTVEPKGTNQVVITLTPVVTNTDYEVLARSNGPDGHWLQFANLLSGGSSTVSITQDPGHVPGLTSATLTNWTFVAGRWDDPLGDELPPLYKELVLRVDPYAPADPYGDPMHDGWSNLQKLQDDWDPLEACMPPPPRLNVVLRDAGTNRGRGNSELSWEVIGNSPLPDYFVVERATRTNRLRTNDIRGTRAGFYGSNGSSPSLPATNINSSPNRTLNRPTNGPRVSLPSSQTNGLLRGGPPYLPRGNPPRYGRGPVMEVVTNAFVEIARIQSIAGQNQYRYVDSNVDELFAPVYRINPHYVPPIHSILKDVSTEGIRATIIEVSNSPTTNGYSLTVPHPIPYARYLLLARDQNDHQWRASGFFSSGTNRDPVHLRVDKKGMMTDGQSPISLPPVKFLRDVVAPEFVAGWGEDSDGDGLPDVYEVLVTHTAPDKADTGNRGVLDGYKEFLTDGWNNLEKFRRRVDPFTEQYPPGTVTLKQPTMPETLKAIAPQSDLRYEPKIEIRVLGTTNFLPGRRAIWALYQLSDPRDPEHVRGNFDLKISWGLPVEQPQIFSHGGP
jgi:hypothetical protein